MPFDYSKHMVRREGQEVKLNIGDEELILKIRKIPWSLRKQFASLATQWDEKQRTRFDLDGYFRECLKYMIVEAPWGKTDDVFLSQVDDELGAALEILVPQAFAGREESIEKLKKE